MCARINFLSMSLLDIFFPKYCISCKAFGSYLCANCFAQLSFDTQVICLECGKIAGEGVTHTSCQKNTSIDGVFCAVSYRGVAKRLVYVLKYQPYVSDVQHILIDLFYESLIQKELFIKSIAASSVVVPIPLFSKKLRQRGYNQSLLLARGLGRKLSLPVKDLLIRVKETKPQFGLRREERKTNVKNVFALKYKDTSPSYTTAFLVDDVLTTGATLLEAAKIVKQYGFKKVWGLTFARD